MRSTGRGCGTAALRRPRSRSTASCPGSARPTSCRSPAGSASMRVQFEVRCPTGLRGTPPHLDLLALRDDAAVAVTVRCTEYLSRRKSRGRAVLRPAARGDAGARALAAAARSSCAPSRRRYRHVDLGALVKYALALGRTFPDRPTTLLYLYLGAARCRPGSTSSPPSRRARRAERCGRATPGWRFARAELRRPVAGLGRRGRAALAAAAIVARLRARYGVTIAASHRPCAVAARLGDADGATMPRPRAPTYLRSARGPRRRASATPSCWRRCRACCATRSSTRRRSPRDLAGIDPDSVDRASRRSPRCRCCARAS